MSKTTCIIIIIMQLIPGIIIVITKAIKRDWNEGYVSWLGEGLQDNTWRVTFGRGVLVVRVNMKYFPMVNFRKYWVPYFKKDLQV